MRNNEERFGANPLKQDTTPLQQLVQQQANSENQQQNLSLDFIVPTEFVELPTKGKFYKIGHPLKDKEAIEIKQMTAKEEDILNSKSLLKKGTALDKLIQSLIVDKTINSDTLTMEDRNAILVAARVSAYGSDYNTEVTCPSCEQKSKYSFNILESLKVEEKETDTQIDENGFFTIQLPLSKWVVTCRVLSGADEKLILKINEAKKKNDSVSDGLLLEQLKMCVVSVQGISAKEVVNRAVDSMLAKDSKYLRTKYQEIVPSLKVISHFSCKSCEYEADMEVPLSTDFFWFK